MSKLIIGSHVGLSAPEYLLGSVKEALSYGANTFMVYTGAPQNTVRKDVSFFNVKEAHELMLASEIDAQNVIVHAPYIINLCSSKAETRQLAKDFLAVELKRVHAMGLNKLVLHPGSRIDQPVELAIQQIADGINHALKIADNDVIICLETMAGKGSEVGTNIKELAEIIKLLNNPLKIGVCLDTCHLSDSGIDLNNFDQFLSIFKKEIGLDYLKCIHVNDSMNPIGAHKDRHQNLGYGHIGFDLLLKVIYHSELTNIPKILETPYVEQNGKFYPPYKIEIEMIKKQTFRN